ncbi:MAG: UDP-N-acetylmuramoyl-L-alanyl-D-glutamate--2,6-diaminopimelate ligase [Candidatus Omnitrophota bacterium]
MNLKTLLESVSVVDYFGPDQKGVVVSGVSSDSRRIKSGYVFVAVRGVFSDGHTYISDALLQHAAAIVVSDPKSVRHGHTPFIVVEDSREALVCLCDHCYDHPYRKMNFIGITGTNGKTTVSYLISGILRAAGINSGLIGTIAHRVKEGLSYGSMNTTPGVAELHEISREMIDAGDKYAVMEVSSHALDQERVQGITFNAAIFTNLTQDHLDYHKTMEEYYRAKQKLFMCYAAPSTTFIVNKDDSCGSRLLESLQGRKFSYGFSSQADFWPESCQLERHFTKAIIQTPAGKIEIETSLVGRHNLYNILAALAWGVTEGLDLTIIKNGIEGVKFVPGRLERVNNTRGFSIFVDYAHTEDALKNVLESLRATLHNGRIITVFGCGGDRDKTKRPKMGRLAVSLSDHVIITSDNPRNEDAGMIASEVVGGLDMGRVEIELDRFEAIKRALLFARPHDIVLIAGKGHEEYQIIKGRTIPFNDKKAIIDILQESGHYV